MGEALDGPQARALVPTLNPRVIILDIGTPVQNSVDATRRIREESPAVFVIGMYSSAEKSGMTAMVRAGASGFLFKDQCGIEQLVHTIREVAAGRMCVGPDMMEIILHEYRADMPKSAVPSVNALDENERQVLRGLADGSSPKDLAKRMRVCPKTITRARDKIMDKLLIFTMAGLIKFAVKHGLTTLE